MRRSSLAVPLDHLLTDNDLAKISQLFSYASVRKELTEIDLSRCPLGRQFKHREPTDRRECSRVGSNPSERLSRTPVHQSERYLWAPPVN